MMDSQLTVYKASAGSGKTFRLATEYIKLLIDNPQKYRHILAVTFTNKATEEMKQRILSQLYGIWKNLPSSDVYMREVTESLGILPEEASAQAGLALRNLIHHYSYFRVETIDSFFQTVLRNLARELDLTANLRIGLNDYQVEEQAVDILVEQLRKNDIVLKWLISYIEQNIEEDKSWNVIGQIKKFGKTIFREYYKSHSEELNARIAEKGFFSKYVKELEAIRSQAKKTMNAIGDEFFLVVEKNGLSSDSFANKSRGIPSYFRKLQDSDFSDKTCLNATVEKCLNDREKWTTKTSPDRDMILSLAEDSLMPLLIEAERIRPCQWRLYLSADVTLRHLNQLRLLSNIEQKVRELNEEANRFLLSDTQQFLHELIDDSDSPFIFEKIGTQLEHIMIDEFQDTSTVQWKNFKILLEETMSHEPSMHRKGVVQNLIVGDVKQSIYRWRNGDWCLLNGIDKQFGDDTYGLSIHSLDQNFRSARRVIQFNNAFFLKAAQREMEAEKEINVEEAEELQQAYADVLQKCPEKKADTGYVSVTLLPKDNYDEEMMELIGQQTDRLLSAGVPQQKIAILVRTNRYIPLIADYFMQTRPDVRIVSDEAFRLDASLAVCTLVNAMRVLVDEHDLLARASIEKAYTHITRQELGTVFDDLRPTLLHMPLMDMTEKLCQLLQLGTLTEQSAYLCTFYDQLQLFATDQGTDLEGFLSLWDESIHEKTIQSNEINGIRLISIHKSKGLEFDNVIIPYCDWRIEMGNTLWCQPTEAPFNQLPIVPIDYSSRLSDTIYDKDYAHEHLQNCVDNLNLLYVAFTRAVQRLFVIGKRDATTTRSYLIQQVLADLNLENAQYEENEVGNQPIFFEYGSFDGHSSDKEKDEGVSANVFLRDVAPLPVDIRYHDSQVAFRQSNRSKDFILSDEEQDDEGMRQRSQYIKMGNVMHSLFSQIRTTDDIPQVLRKLEFEGVLYDEDVSAEKIRNMLEKRLNHHDVREWFSPRWTLYNECSILTTNEDGHLVERRPDRVMTDGTTTLVVDFKFGRQREDYHRQVGEYMQLLRRMGHQQVKGYLWYVYSNQIVEVKA